MSRSHVRPAYAKMDPAHLFDGLFVPVNGKGRPKLFVPLKKHGPLQIGFQGFDQLGAFDQSVLLAVSAQLGIDGLVIDTDPPGEVGQQLRMKMYPENSKDCGRGLRARQTSLRSIALDAGYKDGDGGKSDTRVKDALNRLGNAQIREVNPNTGWDQRCNLLSATFNHLSGELFIAANPRLSGAIFRGQHIKVSLFERNALSGDVAKILHAWLCSNVRLGQSLGNGNGAMLDTLLPHVWGPDHDKKTSAKVMSVRRGRLRDALDEIRDATRALDGGYGWEIDRSSSGLVWVSRPKDLPVQESKFGLTPSDLDTSPGR